jgi:hypothetical protein
MLDNAYQDCRASSVSGDGPREDTIRVGSDEVGDFWAITTYFNPMGYQRRRANYRHFREWLGLPLVAVELSYGPEFHLGDGDAEILIRLRGKDVLWQKERLLNLALQALPRGCRQVLCVDCDVIFEGDNWVERTRQLLEHFTLVQPFSHLRRMRPDWVPGCQWPAETETLHPAAFLLGSGMSLAQCLGTPAEEIKCSTGTAWAANRELLERHGFYDACIVGGGDSAFVRAAYGCFEDAMRLQLMHSERRAHFMAWAQPFHEEVQGNAICLDCDLLHLWHGTPQDRRYRNRNEGLEPFRFDPYRDIALDDNGAWRWSSDKPDMHRYVRGYFESRREDG